MTLRKGVFLTAHNRVDYFRHTMDTWRNVRGVEDWKFYIRLEPSSFIQQHLDVIYETERPDLFKIIYNPKQYGVLEHPWVGFNHMFENGLDFVVRAEDDLLVSEDILEYFGWAAEEYQNCPKVGAVLGFTRGDGPEEEVERGVGFNPWVWGTWHDRWNGVIRNSWDHDYSTYNGTPGNEAGWDWNLDTRIFPALGMSSVAPKASRVQNIGAWGVHGTPENLQQATSFRLDRPRTNYVER